jgi:hypothetical protein
MDALRPLLIAGLVVTEVAIWQWRMIIAHRGSRVSAMLLGIVGAVLQITAITQVVADVSRDLRAPNSAYQSGPPKRLRVLRVMARPVRWHRLQPQNEDGTADERILDRV